MTEIVFTIFSPEDPFFLFTKGSEVLIVAGDWPNIHGEGKVCAEHACAYWFDTEAWDEWFECGEDGACVMVEITAPSQAVGIYEVALSRVTKAEAVEVQDPRT